MRKGTSQPKRRGRPALSPEEGKRLPLNMRTTKELRDQIDNAAKASGRSLAQEIEFRVGRSFLDEKTIDTANATIKQLQDVINSQAAHIARLDEMLAALTKVVSGAVSATGKSRAQFVGSSEESKEK